MPSSKRSGTASVEGISLAGRSDSSRAGAPASTPGCTLQLDRHRHRDRLRELRITPWADAAGDGAAQDVGQRERDDRPGRDGPCTAAGDDEVRLDALIEAVGRIEQAPEG